MNGCFNGLLDEAPVDRGTCDEDAQEKRPDEVFDLAVTRRTRLSCPPDAPVGKGWTGHLAPSRPMDRSPGPAPPPQDARPLGRGAGSLERASTSCSARA